MRLPDDLDYGALRALSNEVREKLARYVMDGGMIIGDACCGWKDFADAFRARMFDFDALNRLIGTPDMLARSKHYATAPTPDRKK